MSPAMKDYERSYTVDSSFPVNTPGGRYVDANPEKAGKKAGRMRIQEMGYQRLSVLVKLRETTSSGKTNRGPFHYRVTAIKKPSSSPYPDASFKSEYKYHVKALTDDEIEKYENGNFKSLL